jgi:hypothetical protein
VVEGGKRGVLPGGKSAVYNAEESCPACCIEFSQTWSFTDVGFIDGGQNGAYRAYDDPNDVPASPWTILNGGLGLRLDWEDDKNCRNHNYNTDTIDAMTRAADVKIALVYDEWFDRYGGLPEGWQLAGQWSIRENVLSGVETISIYAVDPAEAEALIAHLREYAGELPATVTQSGPYTE